MRYLAEADAAAVPRLASIQNSWSLLDRQFEIGLAEVAMREAVPLIGYSPLAAGLLTGKYNPQAPAAIPGSRSSLSAGFASRFKPQVLGAAAAYAGLAREAGLEPAAMALAFAAAKPFVGSVLMAASSAEQLAGNLKAIEVRLPKDLLKAIDAVHDAAPNPA
jgi:aryl-alcohol dehydrogenase-like predicted oxidoreductase